MHAIVPAKFAELHDGKIKHLSDGECFECNQAATTYSIPGDMIVVHTGEMCIGFRTRFTPTEDRPLVTKAMDEIGNVIPDFIAKPKKRETKAKVVKSEGEDE